MPDISLDFVLITVIPRFTPRDLKTFEKASFFRRNPDITAAQESGVSPGAGNDSVRKRLISATKWGSCGLTTDLFRNAFFGLFA
jgi:hypothetical protein